MPEDQSIQFGKAPADLWKIPGNPAKNAVFGTDNFNFKGICDLNQLIKSKLHILSTKYDLIVGVPRSGLLAANMIALHLNLPLITLNEVKEFPLAKLSTSRRGPHGELWKPGTPLRILVVDDSCNSGRALRNARELIAAQAALKTSTVHFMAIYATRDSVKEADIHFQIIDQPRIFEWNFMHHNHAQNFLFDLDGVLCVDGPSESSDSPDAYLHHLENAQRWLG